MDAHHKLILQVFRQLVLGPVARSTGLTSLVQLSNQLMSDLPLFVIVEAVSLCQYKLLDTVLTVQFLFEHLILTVFWLHRGHRLHNSLNDLESMNIRKVACFLALTAAALSPVPYGLMLNHWLKRQLHELSLL